jgi:glycosyltransferase involved in cell wall biosynthesis
MSPAQGNDQGVSAVTDGLNQDPPRISFLVPAYNEENYLLRLIDSVDVARARYLGGKDSIEVIVADNASTDRTAQIARERGCRVQPVAKRVIAAARNGAASAARGEILCFCDADMRIHPETFNAIDACMAAGKTVAGATGVRLERMSLGLAVTFASVIPFVWILGIDTGVVFCRREDFLAVGGYDEGRSYAEDVNFLMKLKRLGRTRGQRFSRLTTAKALSSTRKWDKHGEWHQLRMMITLAIQYPFRRHAVDKFAKSYWYDDPR